MNDNSFEKVETNIISWYDFKKNSNILYIGNKDDILYKYLKEYNKVCLYDENKKNCNKYDYIICIHSKLKVTEILETINFLEENGKLLIGFNNEYGISRFINYDYKNRKSLLECADKNEVSLEMIEQILNKKGYIYQKVYMPFPNINKTDLILTKETDDLPNKLDKYFAIYTENVATITNEIELLRNISKYDKNLFLRLSNSYLIEASKKDLVDTIQYISFNNYRNKEYQLTTIIKDNVVEKKATNKQALKNIKRIANNLDLLRKYKFNILDNYDGEKIYSKYIKNEKTLDILLSENYRDEEYIINMFNELKNKLLVNSKKYSEINKKELIPILKETDNEILNKFNYLEDAFYDMVPKNCFLIDNELYFFDQEWMKKNLPVEFIIYRSVINSYDLIKKIELDEILEKLGILEYKELFINIDNYLIGDIIDKKFFEKINRNNKNMYELLYDKEVLEIQNEDYKKEEKRKNEYIKALETKINNIK